MPNVRPLRLISSSSPDHDPEVGPWTGAISEFGDFADPVWRFEHAAPGYADVFLKWDVGPPRGSCLETSEWANLIQEGKRLIWSLTVCNTRGRDMQGCHLSGIHKALMRLLQWMAENDYATTADIGRNVAAEYLRHLDRTIGRQSRNCLRRGTVARYIDVVIRIHEQREWIFHGRRSRTVEHPFDGRTAYEEAAAIGSNERGWIPPVPDEVWSPVVARALEWLVEPAAHVIRAARVISAMRGRNLSPVGSDIAQALMSEPQGRDTLDWFVGMEQEGRGRPSTNGASTNRVVLRTFRSLHLDVRDACTIVLQAMLGLRVSEVVGLSAGLGREVGIWPACIETRPSLSGLTEIFFLKGHIFKGQEKPLATEWVAGSRPRGTEYNPPAVRAVMVLDDLLPWWGRERPHLLARVHFDLNDPGRVDGSAIRTSDIGAGQARFVQRHVELPHEWREHRLSTHQWRKSFAIRMVRMDERLLGAVSEHFKHLSIAMTEQGYVGCDPDLLDLINDEGVRLAAQLLTRAVRERSPVVGKMADALRDCGPSIVAAYGVEEDDPERTERLADLLRDEDVRLWPSPWGYCLFRPEMARCHHAAKGAFDLSARQPEYGFRHPGLCCDCANLLVDVTHEGFWRERHAENATMFAASSDAGDELGARVAQERMRVSGSYLRQLEKAVHQEVGSHAV